MPTNNKGFTLIELIIVICVIGILLATVFLSKVYDKPDKALKEAAAQLYMDLQEAKSQAVLDRAVTQIRFNENTDSYTVTISGNTRTVSLDNFGQGITFGSGPAKYKVDNSSTFGGNFVTFPEDPANNQFRDVMFQPNGLLSSNGGGFGGYAYLTNSTQSACYAIGVPQVVGRVVMRKTDSEKWK